MVKGGGDEAQRPETNIWVAEGFFEENLAPTVYPHLATPSGTGVRHEKKSCFPHLLAVLDMATWFAALCTTTKYERP